MEVHATYSYNALFSVAMRQFVMHVRYCSNAISHTLDIFCQVMSACRVHVEHAYFSTIMALEIRYTSCNMKRYKSVYKHHPLQQFSYLEV